MRQPRTGAGNTALLLALLLAAGSGRAATQMPDILINITGTVIASAPCKINDDRLIEVHFGNDVQTTKVNGSNYQKRIDYTLDCRGAATNKLRMQFQGAGAAFDGRYLGTYGLSAARHNLGIKLLANGNWLERNSWVNFDYPAAPVLTAVPIGEAGSRLEAGYFFATGTLVVEYQ